MRRSAFMVALAFAACSGEEAPDAPVKTAVLKTLNFEREEPRGVSVGMNLDGWVSEANDDRSCRKEDFIDPTGVEGIDNELARLLPLIDLAGENAVQGLVQGAINEGRLLMIIHVVREEDGTATIEVQRGDDVPLLGTDNAILPGQTLFLHAEPFLGATTAVEVEPGVLETAPFEVKLPIVVFSQLYQVDMQDAIFRLELDDAGHVQRGLLAGGLPIADLVQVLETAGNFGPEFEELFGDAVRDSADLARDEAGSCLWMSAAVTFDAVPAFTF